MNHRLPLALLLLPLLIASTACSQEAPPSVHPEKQVYLSAPEWPLVSPGQAKFADFRPFEARYQRFYSNGAGEPRQDWVLLSVKGAAWYGEPALLVALHDAGNVDYDDTAMRSQTVYLRRSDLSVLFATAPTSGTPHDVDVVRVLDDRVVKTVVRSEPGTSESAVLETSEPVFWGQRFGFGSLNYLVWGAMDLASHDQFRFDRVYYPAINQAGPAFVRNRGLTSVEDASGHIHEAYLLETTLNLNNNSVSQWYITGQAPYLIASGRRDVSTGEIRWSRKLERLDVLD